MTEPLMASSSVPVRASGEPQKFDPTSLDPMDPRPFNMTLEDLRELVRTEAGRIAYVNDELDRLKMLHDGEVQHLKAASASPSDDGARQPQLARRLRKLIRDWRMRAEPQAPDYPSPISRCCAEEIEGCAQELEDELEGR